MAAAMTVVIRPVTAGEIPSLLQLVEKYWDFEGLSGFDVARVGAELGRLCGDPALGSGWIARAGDRPAGYLLAVYVFSLEHLGLTAEIDEFFVLPSFRGQGIGSELLREAEDEFARRKCTNVYLQLGRENDGARAFYRAHGFGERSGFDLLDKMLPRG